MLRHTETVEIERFDDEGEQTGVVFVEVTILVDARTCKTIDASDHEGWGYLGGTSTLVELDDAEVDALADSIREIREALSDDALEAQVA